MSVLLTPRGVFVSLVLALCATMPYLAVAIDEPFYQDVFARMMIWAIAATSLNLILGFGGMVSFGHALYLGVGSYAVGIAAYHDVHSAWVQWPLGLAASALVALVFGAVSLRTRGVYFIMITMALAQMVYYLAVSIEEYGSDDGLVIYQRSDLGLGFYDLDEPLHLYYTIFALLLLSLFASWRLVESRFGVVVRGARSNEARVEAMGFDTYRYRLVCFVVAGVMCGAAGLLSANVESFVSPDVIHWTRSGELIFMVVLGGMGSLFGPLTGALVFWLLSEFLAGITEHWHLIFGPFLIVVVLFAPRGIDGLLERSGTRVAEAGGTPPLLRVQGLRKSFGGLTATDDLSLEVAPGEVHAIIGPNGAGKTTLIAQLSGMLRPDAGRIVFAGADITALRAHERVRHGLARSFQITSVLKDFTALANVALAVQSRQGHSFRFWRPARGDPRLETPARAILAGLGLGERTEVLAGNLAHGEQRQLEIAMALALEPRLLLLDEPTAGMGAADSEAMTRHLATLKGRYTMVLVEHDMDAVFALADRITVLVYGRPIASGSPEQIRADAAVRQAYLGEG